MFQGEDRLPLLQIGLFSLDEDTHESLQRKPSLFETVASILVSLSELSKFLK
jgi:hypothetical protein